MRIFEEIPLSDWCYIQEVAWWIAFGRPPRFYGNEDGAEGRHYGPSEWHGEVMDVFDGYHHNEFLTHGIEVDFDRYRTAREIYGGQTGAEYLGRRTNWLGAASRDEEDGDEEYGEYPHLDDDPFEGASSLGGATQVAPKPRKWTEDEILALRKQLDVEYADDIREADWALEQEQKLDHPVDRARAQVFVALAAGRLKAEGWLAFTPEEIALRGGPSKCYDGGFEAIPASAWTMSGFDWGSSTLTTPTGVYLAVQVDTQEMFELFPRPDLESNALRMDKFGGAIILSDDSAIGEPAAQPKRGRPPQTVPIKEVVTNLLVSSIKRGHAPEKLDALVQEAIEFAKNITGKTICRTTAQNYVNVAKKRANVETRSTPGRAIEPAIHATN